MKKEKINKAKKENSMFMLLVILLISIIMCVSSFGIATWARYRSTQGGNITAEIAKWSFKVNNSTQEFAEIDLAKTISFDHVVDTEIAPGTYGSFNLEMDGKGSEVSIDCYIDINVENKPTNMKFYTESSHSADSELQIVNNKIQIEDEILLSDNPMKKTQIIYWDWAYRTEKCPSQEVLDKYITEQPISGLKALVDEYNSASDENKPSIALKINDKIDTYEAGGEAILPIKVTGIQKSTNGLESKKITITSDTSKDYDIGDELTFSLEFTESVYADENKTPITESTAPIITLDFESLTLANNPIAKIASLMNTQILLAEGNVKQATFISVEKNKINYKYNIVNGDKGNFKIVSIVGTLYSKGGRTFSFNADTIPEIKGNNINAIAKNEIAIGSKVYYSSNGTYTLDKANAQSGTTWNDKIAAEKGTYIHTAKYFNGEWYILDIDGETVQMVPCKTFALIRFQGANGYNNAVNILNECCSALFSNSEKNISARSINIEDIEKVINKCNKTGFEEFLNNYESYSVKYGENSILYKGSTKCKYPVIYAQENLSTINGTTLHNNFRQSSMASGYLTGYKTGSTIQPYLTDYHIESTDINTYFNSKYREILSLDDSDGYWVASRGCYPTDDYCCFGVRLVEKGRIAQASTYFSDGDTAGFSKCIFPVVTLNINQLQEKEDGTGFEVK